MPASKPRALVVDDDPALRMLCRVNLELDGFEVLEASTIAEAEAAAREGHIDVALLDVHLAGCDTHSLRARLQANGIPVALVTGSADVDAYRDEVDGVLTKPFEPQTLVELARRLARVVPA
jgi:DNA-binding response OmpR family regulator